MSRTTDRSDAMALAYLRQHLEAAQRRSFVAALDRLEAENQRLRDALKEEGWSDADLAWIVREERTR